MEREHVLRVTIHDCVVDTFRAGGSGGQHQNKRETGVRVRHPPSGAVGESREERSQLQNKKTAFVRMAESPRFRAWVQQMHSQLPPIEKVVDEMMSPENLVVEYRQGKKWIQELA